ncbi:histone acetyltransferase YNG2 NDAI_0C01770 [Naumovozyma dairenensis CBS 421]|uniref:Chromatin modification-related protein n=1 Tax=Naumovozyma dairenensis (strain ATCC 10597 / BCRC 20456 / CBS 421 / NBRC 0211 / NRRL Y-12639) TaxID=1071378 RepID=G0W7S7_NAUDC|nr:hypothetical protein NDAI_0C01770 [Naumovozyma dairenensis CBS 421]CCD23838.1 hypothetical protein NDAI_0C01770 [Naumovozyma dairenensis CBS 421]
MDPSLVLEQTIQDVSNLQAEFRFIYEEISSADSKALEEKKKYMQKDSQIHKFIKQHGSTTVQPDEDKLYKEINEGMKACEELQNEKSIFANTALFLVARHLSKLEKNIALLEEDGVLAPLENEIESGVELSRESSVVSTTPGERKRRGTSSSETGPSLKKKKQSRTASVQRGQKETELIKASETPKTMISTNVEIPKYNDDLFANSNDNEDEDKTLYCFCQNVSYGEMVACDGPNCKYEWFHYGCVNLKEPPKGTWYCPDCRQEMAKNKLKKKKV